MKIIVNSGLTFNKLNVDPDEIAGTNKFAPAQAGLWPLRHIFKSLLVRSVNNVGE